MDPLRLSDAMAGGEALDKLAAYGITDVAQLAKQYLDTRGSYDSSIRYPGKDASPEDQRAFWKKLGAPDTPEGYPIPEAAKQSLLGSTLEDLRAFVHKANSPVDIWTQFADGAVQVMGEREKQRADQATATREQWAAQAQEAFGANLATVQGQIDRLVGELAAGDPEVKQILEQTGILKHPKIMAKFAELAKLTDPARNVDSLEGGRVSDPNKEAQELALKGRALQSSDAWKKSHADHDNTMFQFMSISKRLDELGFDGVTDPRLKPDHMRTLT